jgi:hypothetical protein
MSTDIVVADAEIAVTGQRPGRSARRGVSDLISSLLRRDLLGVRVSVWLLIFPLMLATLSLQLVSRQGWNHPPDSRYYLTMMARDMGYSWPQSIHQEQQISPGLHLAPWYFADNDPTWQMVRIRLLYPVLSLPFISLWGLSGGSMAIPFLGTVLFLWATARVLQRLYGPAVTVIVAGAFSITITITEFAWAGTDTLAMGLAAVLVLNLPIERRIGRANLVWLGAASVFIALTRQVGVLAPAMAGAGWLWLLVRERSWRNRWLGSLVVTAGTTFLIQVLSMTLTSADTAGVVGRGQTTYWGVLRQFVHYMKIVTEQACTYMWHTDRLLYALLIAAGISVVARFSSDSSAVFVGAVVSTYIITAGVGFSSLMRYEVIMFPAAAVAAGLLVQLALSGHLPRPASALDAEVVADPLPTPARRWSAGLGAAVAGSAPGRFLGLHQPRQDRWKPQLLVRRGPGESELCGHTAGQAAGRADPADPVRPSHRDGPRQRSAAGRPRLGAHGPLPAAGLRPAGVVHPRQGRYRSGQPELHGPGREHVGGVRPGTVAEPDREVGHRQDPEPAGERVRRGRGVHGPGHLRRGAPRHGDHALRDLEQERLRHRDLDGLRRLIGSAGPSPSCRTSTCRRRPSHRQ